MLIYDRALVIAAASSILDRGGWCMLERCVDVPRQLWEPRILLFDLVPNAVADAIEEELERESEHDARLAGCDRRTLQPDPAMGAYLCYLAQRPAAANAPAEPLGQHGEAPEHDRLLVRQAMNPIVATVRGEDTLRSAASRMTERGVGAAVVLDEGCEPAIITERDILRAGGAGKSIDTERVDGHMSHCAPHACADWPVEWAAALMVRRGLRHLVVLDGAQVVGILSMRDIVHSWMPPTALEAAD
jgi:CBS domain-containing protein